MAGKCITNTHTYEISVFLLLYLSLILTTCMYYIGQRGQYMYKFNYALLY